MAVSKISRVVKEAKFGPHEKKRLEETIALLSRQLEESTQKKFKTLRKGKRKAVGKTFIRLVVPDTHGSHIDPNAAAAFLGDIELLKPKQVVLLGDHLDCGGLLAQHHTIGFVAETDATFTDDINAANEFLDAVQLRTGNVETYYILGNHEARIEKFCITMALRNQQDSQLFFDQFGTHAVLGLEKRGINVVNRNECYNGLKKKGTIKLDKCMFHHGTRTGVHAAKANLDDLGGNIVFGHTHRISQYTKETWDGIIGAWSVGCLSQLRPMYGDTNVSNWAHGYGIQIVESDGTFLHLNVPIIDGRSFLGHLSKLF